MYNDYAASPVHRFYQMWQQLNCSEEHASWENPSGCNAKLFSWVEVTVGAGTNGAAQPPNFSTEYSPTATTTGEGSTALGFYNVQQGDAPYFKSLADTYAMSDNFHQSVNGGTGANHIMFGHGDAIWFSDGNGHALPAPHNVEAGAGTLNAGIVDEVENPNPAGSTNNWYTRRRLRRRLLSAQRPPAAVPTAIARTPRNPESDRRGVFEVSATPINPRCETGHYYLLNNYNPGYFGNGATLTPIPARRTRCSRFRRLPCRALATTMLAHNISWKYYGDQWDAYSGAPSYTPQPKSRSIPNGLPGDPYQINYGAVGSPNGLGVTIAKGQADEYCNICNPFQYDTSIMANNAVRDAHIQDTRISTLTSRTARFRPFPS